MTYEELRVQLDINDPADVLATVGRPYEDRPYEDGPYENDKWFVICDEGDCHLFGNSGVECDIREVKMISNKLVPTGLKKVVIPDSVTSIWDAAFYGCSSLTSVTIPDSVTCIWDAAFFGCTGLTNIAIPDSVTSIGYRMFGGCHSLTSVMMPDSVTSIKWYAFSYCTSLTNMTIPSSVTSISGNAFYGCTSLKSIVFKGKTSKQVKAMENYPFGLEDESAVKCKKVNNI